ncbi:MAG: type III-A CRISPR-associated protein Cas10/Csm1 [Archaeoglobaceae archaeon]|nr:type III-A CRISPR-associated protein Cas10/Csm1 [Archaeoglobaceae archaeon]MCX8152680.1 type III-A CRISPR-associated protein Cas10/Csm1 [Archaeoglobaceae archaeon]
MDLKEKTVIAAMLHDIGKVLERFGEKGNHAELTKEFLKKFDEEIAEIAYGHHRSSRLNTLKDVRRELKEYAEIVCEADNISSKVEREEIDEEILKDWSKKDRKQRPILSILSTVDIGKEDSKDMYFYTRELTLSKFYLEPKEIDHCRADYAFFEKMEDEIEMIWKHYFKKRYDFKKLIFTLCNILKKYLFFVPSATYSYKGIPIPDCSLYEHLRTTAVFSYTLLENKEKFVLIVGDISGIQDFIAKITSKKALRFLKGRSFFIELLNIALAFRICKELEIPPTQIVYASAGNFIIIAPKNEKIKKIDYIRKEINKELLKIGIYVAIAFNEFSYEDAENFEKIVEELRIEVEKMKLRRYGEIIDCVFFEQDVGDECEVCKSESEIIEIKIKDEEIKVCKNCYENYELADKLVKAERVATLENKEVYIGIYEDGRKGKRILGVGFEISTNPEDVKDSDYVFVSNSTDFLKETFLDNGAACGFIFLNLALHDIEFDEISESSEGAKYLGIMKIDGDNIGKIFSEGIKRWWSKRGVAISMTPSRYATLSSLLDLFFGYCMNIICKEGKFFTDKPFKEKRNIYVVFCGGDDALIVGPWDQVLSLASKICEEFSIFTKNKNFSLSGTVTVVRKKFPVYRSYMIINENIKCAKKYRRSFLIFGKIINSDDLKNIESLANYVAEKIKKKEISRSVIHNLIVSLNHGGNHRKMWTVKYIVARHPELKFLDEKIDEDFKYGFSNILVALRWAELLTRGEVYD